MQITIYWKYSWNGTQHVKQTFDFRPNNDHVHYSLWSEPAEVANWLVSSSFLVYCQSLVHHKGHVRLKVKEHSSNHTSLIHCSWHMSLYVWAGMGNWGKGWRNWMNQEGRPLEKQLSGHWQYSKQSTNAIFRPTPGLKPKEETFKS